MDLVQKTVATGITASADGKTITVDLTGRQILDGLADWLDSQAETAADERTMHFLGLIINAVNSVRDLLGLKKEQVIIKTGIPEGDECTTTAEDLVSQKCKIIFADSFGHEQYLLPVAKAHPEVEFCHATGTKAHTEKLANYHNAFASIYEGRYLAGIAAGLKLNEMIAEGKITADKAVIGYVGAFPYAEVKSGLTSFFLGARSVCPTATMKVRYTGSWYDQAKEQESANALINNDKCVLISQHADSLGAPTACEMAKVPNISYNGSTYDAGPNTFIISSAINWAPYFAYIIKQVTDGKAIDTDWTGSIKTGSVVLTGINTKAAAKGTEEALKKAIDEFKAGTLHVFDTSKFTVNGETLTTYLADVDDFNDFVGETEVVKDGYFHESEYRSAPYFDLTIDGIEHFLDESK
jgi:basic membrane protein A